MGNKTIGFQAFHLCSPVGTLREIQKLPMRLHLLALSLLVLVSHASAQEQLGTIKAVDGTVYDSVVLTSIKPDKITFISKAGAGSLSRNNLTKEDNDRILAIQVYDKQAQIDKASADQEESEFQEPWLPIIAAVEKDDPNYSGRMKMIASAQESARILLRRNMATPDQIKGWCDLVVNKQVQEGMPAIFLLLAWGSPDRTTDSSSGYSSWYYSAGFLKGTSVTVKGPFVVSWISSH